MKRALKNPIIHTLLATIFVLGSQSGFAQNEEDALRYSLSKLSGTSRFTSMGGAFTALGGDLSAISLNPAAIGVYRRSEFSFTPSFYLQQSEGEYNGQNALENRLNFHVGNIGYIGNFYTSRNKWKSAGVSIGYNRMNNFSNEISFEGVSPGSSILDTYVEDVNQNGGTSEQDIIDAYPFGAGLAYRAYLINPTANDSMLYDHVLMNSEGVLQKKSINRSGGIGEYFLAFGGNYNDRLYIGGSVGLSTIRYREESVYREIPAEDDQTNDLVELRRYENLLTTGTGVNFKFGIITRVTNWLRLGTSVHSPTYYRMADNWDSQIDADYENGDAFRETSENGSFDYKLVTPTRFNVGLGIVMGKKGLISAEYEYADFSQARLGTPRFKATEEYDFNLENERITSLYQPAGTIKAGMEWRLDPFRLRGGFSHQGNVYKEEVGEDNSSNTYTFGIGFREDDYFIDLGYAFSQFSQRHYPYYLVENPAKISTDTHYLMFTVGFRY